MPLQHSTEDYLETIYVLSRENSAVRSVDVAHRLNYSRPSVSRAVKKLKDCGHLTIMDDGSLVLAESGLAVAKDMYERHTILAGLFCSLGVPEDIATEDACRVEHALSAFTFARLKAMYSTLIRAAGKAQGAQDKPKEKKKKKKKAK